MEMFIPDRHNLRAALDWCVATADAQAAELGLRLVSICRLVGRAHRTADRRRAQARGTVSCRLSASINAMTLQK
jgi:hypothetical protein